MRWGYKRREPDPIGLGVMAPAPRPTILKMPLPRRSVRCKLRGHKPVEHHLHNRGERWGVLVVMCQRCHTLLDANAGTRVTM